MGLVSDGVWHPIVSQCNTKGNWKKVNMNSNSTSSLSMWLGKYKKPPGGYFFIYKPGLKLDLLTKLEGSN